MKHAVTTVLVAALATILFSGVSQASGGNENAKILLHLMDTTTKNACTRAMPDCAGIVTHGNVFPAVYFAYVLVTDANLYAGIAGMQFGITYGSGATDGVGVDIWTWTLCGTLEFQQPSPAWPSSGGGNMVTWDYVNACQKTIPPGNDAENGVVAAAGYFYCGSYGDAQLKITPRPVDGYAKVANCSSSEDIVEGPGDGTPLNPPVTNEPTHLGWVGFGASQGYSPCGITPVEATTWSRLKTLDR